MHSAAFSVDVPEILPPVGRLDDNRGDKKTVELCVLRGELSTLQRYKIEMRKSSVLGYIFQENAI